MIIKVFNLSKRDVMNDVTFDTEKNVYTDDSYDGGRPDLSLEVKTSYMVDRVREELRYLGYKEV